jgi:hypothetical protein
MSSPISLVVPAARATAAGWSTTGVPSSSGCGTEMPSRGCPTTANVAINRLASASGRTTSGEIAIRCKWRRPDVIIPCGDGLNAPLIFRGTHICLAAPRRRRLDQSGVCRRRGESACSCRGDREGWLDLRLRRAMAVVDVTALLRIIDDRRIGSRGANVSRSRRTGRHGRNACSNRRLCRIPPEAVALRGGE